MFVTLVALQATQLVRLESLDLKSVVQDWGQAAAGRSVDGNPIKIGKQTFTQGLGSHALAELPIQLGGKAKRFRAMIGVDAEVGGQGSITVQITLDGKLAYRSGILRGGEEAKKIDLDLTGAKTMFLEITDAGDGINYDHADLADATIEVIKDAKISIVPLKVDNSVPSIAPIDFVRTEIHGAKMVGTTPGRDFIFRIPVTGKGPLSVTVKGLPKGLGFDKTRRVIVGKVETAGTYRLDVEATGPGGSAYSNLTIKAGKDMLALTPPMGWNSWNVWGLDVDTDKVRAAANSFETTGLADHGYTYVNIDDGWEAGRSASGEIETNSRFPDMRLLTDYVHSKGLKVGLYSSPGPKTCGGYEGSYLHEEQDAKTYAKWGFDYLKHDWCSYSGIVPNPDLFGMKLPYVKMKNALEDSNRDIVLSMCQYGMGDVYKWGKSVGGQLWRTTGDITDTWSSMSGIGFDHSVRSPYAGPGAWNDPDMLVVGWLGWSSNLRPTRLTKHEQVTHITLWSMLAAPLLIGCDLTRIDDFTLRVLCNHDVIAVDQDELGKAAVQVWKKDKLEAWTRPLSDGSIAVAIFNRNRDKETVNVSWKDLGISPNMGPELHVRDLWLRKDLGGKRELKVSVGGHGAQMFKVRALVR